MREGQHCLSQLLEQPALRKPLMGTASHHGSPGGFRGISSEPAQLPGALQGLPTAWRAPTARAQLQHSSHHQTSTSFLCQALPLPPLSSPDPSDPTHNCTPTLFQALKAFSKAQVFLQLSTLPNPHESWHSHLPRLKMNETI